MFVGLTASWLLAAWLPARPTAAAAAAASSPSDPSGADRLQDAPPFLGNFLIEDTCQFQLCGPAYGGEWGAGGPPLAGSCSGDCSLLAITLNANKFHKEFLWSSCARMCGAKYPADQSPEYKNRFLCMESCYAAYALVSPHHNIARYCMQAACDVKSSATSSLHQVDCFQRCTSHVSSSLPESTWKVWARAIASTCSNITAEGDTLNQRLKCGDGAVWEHMSHVEQRTEERLASLCLNSLCSGSLKCGLACLNHIHTLPDKHRVEWGECGRSSECGAATGGGGEWSGVQQCADTCLAARQEAREQARLARLQLESQQRQTQLQQLHYSSHSPSTLTLFLPLLPLLPLLSLVHFLVRL